MSGIFNMASKAETISFELEVTINLIRERSMSSTDFDEIYVLTRLLDMIQRDVLGLSNELYSLDRSARLKAA